MENPEIQKIGVRLEQWLFEPLIERMLEEGHDGKTIVRILDGYIGHNKVYAACKKWKEQRSPADCPQSGVGG
ncbi:MAG: hypothetical protein AAFY26_18725 [Cyanobacteria bacterium J06638_22]